MVAHFRPRNFRGIFTVWVGLLLSCTSPAGGEFLTWSQVDYVYADDLGRFQQIWTDAETRTVRIAMLGDSQETAPGGGGAVYVPRLNFEFYQRYQNSPETPIAIASNFGGGSPPGKYLLRGTSFGDATRLNSNQILPSINVRSHSTQDGLVNITGDSLGQIAILQHDADSVASGAQLAGGTYFNTDGIVRAEIFAATNASSGEIQYQALPKDGSNISYFVPATTQGTSSLGLESAAFEVKSHITEPLDFNGKSYMQLEVFGTDDNKRTDILGFRYMNETYPHGVVVHSFAAGGYRTNSFLNNHAAAGPMLDAYGDWDAIWIHTGVNDAYKGAGKTAAQYKNDVEELIHLIRSPDWLNDITMKIIVSPEVYRANGSATQDQEFDQYAGALKQIAAADANVLVLNSRRLTEDLGWGVGGNPGQFLFDIEHYNDFGARALAAAEIQALVNHPEPTTSVIMIGFVLTMMTRRTR